MNATTLRDYTAIGTKYRYEVKKYAEAINNVVKGFSRADETFDYKKEGYKLSTDRLKLAVQRLGGIRDDFYGDKRNISFAELYDRYNMEQMTYWSFLQFSRWSNNEHLNPLLPSSLTFEFRDENLTDTPESLYPFERTSLKWRQDFVREMASGLLSLQSNSDKGLQKQVDLGDGRGINYTRILANAESPDMYAYPTYWESAQYVANVTANKRTLQVWISNRVVDAWKMAVGTKFGDPLKYSASQYAEQLVTKSEFRLHSLIETPYPIATVEGGYKYHSKLAVLVSGEALEYPSDIDVFDGGLDRQKLSDDNGDSFFFHKTFGYADVVILVPYEVVPLYFEMTYPFGLLYDYEQNTYPKDVAFRNPYTLWYNSREMGFPVMIHNTRASLASYYITRLNNTLSEVKNEFSTKKLKDDNAVAELATGDIEKSKQLVQFVPRKNLTDVVCWPYDKKYRGEVEIIDMVTSKTPYLRTYSLGGENDGILKVVWMDNGYDKVAKRCRDMEDFSSRYNGSFLADMSSRLEGYNARKFNHFMNTERVATGQVSSSGLGYHIYKNEIKMLCGKYSRQIASLDSRSAVLLIGSRASFSRGLTMETRNEKTKSKKKKKPQTATEGGIIKVKTFSIDENGEDEEDYDDEDDYMDIDEEDEELSGLSAKPFNFEDDDSDDDDDFAPDAQDDYDEEINSDSESSSRDEESDPKESKKRKREDADDEEEIERKTKKTKEKFNRFIKLNNRGKHYDKFYTILTNQKTNKPELVSTVVLKKFNAKNASVEDLFFLSVFDIDSHDPSVDKLIHVIRDITL